MAVVRTAEPPLAGDGLLAAVLDLEQLDEDLFRGWGQRTAPFRVFGGEVAGQALIAAGRTVPGDRGVHSLHSYFLRPGDPSAPILYRVERVRDGGSFTTRRTVAEQHGKAIFILAASFHVREDGFAHQLPRLDAPAPDELPLGVDVMAAAGRPIRRWYEKVSRRFPFEMRFHGELPRVATLRGERVPPTQRIWLRASEPLPDDPLLHVCAITYASDMFLLAAALPPHGEVIDSRGLLSTSLDHAVWFHAPFRADDWLYYDQEGSWAGSGRALCRGLLFDREGTLVASVVQEGLIRRHRAD
jgi:acyl-CoA thioesterase-2